MIQVLMMKRYYRKKDYLATQKGKLRLGAKHAQELKLQTGIKPQNLLA